MNKCTEPTPSENRRSAIRTAIVTAFASSASLCSLNYQTASLGIDKLRRVVDETKELRESQGIPTINRS